MSRDPDLEIWAAFFSNGIKDIKYKNDKRLVFAAVPMKGKKLSLKSKTTTKAVKKLISIFKPDVVHIIGTEREVYYDILNSVGRERVIFSLTGIMSECAANYFGGLSKKVFYNRTIGDILRNGGPINEQKLFKRISKTEELIIKNGKYFMGRTNFDRNFVFGLNENARYIKCGEVINPLFFDDQWNYRNCEKQSMFVSQASYPLKGLHKLLDSFPSVLEKFPNAKIYIGGPNILNEQNLIAKIKMTTYGKFIKNKINKLKLPKNSIVFTGPLFPVQMKELYLKCNLFVIPSAIENSPNSLAEAMCLGVPCIGASVGGIPDMIDDNKNGILYPFNDAKQLSQKIINLFENADNASQLGKAAADVSVSRYKNNDVVNITKEAYFRIIGEK